MKLRADFHSHSNYSRDSLINPKTFIECNVAKGVTCAAVTDHNEIEGAFYIQKLAKEMDAPLRIIVGEEVKTAEGEIYGLFLKELVPRDMSPEDTVRAIHEQRGLAVIPHPYDIFRRSVLTDEAIERVKHDVDAIEGHNCRNILAKHDRKARDLAASVDKPITVATDAHSPMEIGKACLEIDDFETPEDLLRVLRGGRIVGGRSLPMVHWLSTYAKIRWRLGLKPTYATPPRPAPGSTEVTVKLALLISGSGTTLQNFLDQIAAGKLDATIEVVVSSRSDIQGVERARKAGIDTHVVRRRDYESQEAFSDAITAILDRYDVDLVLGAGFLQRYIFPPKFAGRMLNIHPGLLPQYGGQGMFGHHVHEAVIAAGEKESGCTVIIADHEYDHGPAVLEKRVPVLPGDTPEALAERVFEAECEAYPEAVRIVAKRLGIEA